MDIILGGAGTGTVVAVDLAIPEIKQGEPYRLVGGHVDHTFAGSGDVTFTMGTVRRPILLCGPNNPAPVITTTHVS
jgi:hypothetical protein